MPPPPSAAGQHTDLRLLLPAIVAWCVTALLLGADAGHAPALLTAAGLAAGAAALLLLAVHYHHRHHADPDDEDPDADDPDGNARHHPHAPLAMVAALLLTGAAATACTVLHTADLHRGPLPALARSTAAAPDAPVAARTPVPTPTPAPAPSSTHVSVDLTITGDPHTRTSHARGSNPGHPVLTVDAIADQVTVSTGATTRTRTPVTVIVQERDAAAWQGLLPSARIAAQARVLPASGAGRDTAAALLAQGSPRQLAPPSWAQRLAGRLRQGLREACAGLPSDARALLPGLVVGDTSAMPDDLDEAFRATDLVHLTAVSGANLSIVLAVLLGAPARAGTAERGGLAALLGVPLRVTALLGAVLTVAFVTLCRPDPSVLRAAATGLVGLLALAMGRPRQAVPALAGGVLVLLLVDPFLARSYGFLLSALATLGCSPPVSVGRGRCTSAAGHTTWPAAWPSPPPRRRSAHRPRCCWHRASAWWVSRATCSPNSPSPRPP